VTGFALGLEPTISADTGCDGGTRLANCRSINARSLGCKRSLPRRPSPRFLALRALGERFAAKEILFQRISPICGR
jgi:hypothetical protein